MAELSIYNYAVKLHKFANRIGGINKGKGVSGRNNVRYEVLL